jgi:hypothetical protein
METKQTAVDYIVNVVNSCIAPDYIPNEIVKQAKQMEKEQVKRMYTEEEVYDLLVEWNMYQKGEPRVDEDEIPNGFMSFNEWFKEISKQKDNEK